MKEYCDFKWSVEMGDGEEIRHICDLEPNHKGDHYCCCDENYPGGTHPNE